MVQGEVIDGTDSQYALAREPLSNAVHECPADRTEVISHRLARSDRFVLLEHGQLLPTSNVSKIAIVDKEVRRKHRCCDLATVGTVADKRIYEPGFCGGLIERVVSYVQLQCYRHVLTKASWTAPQKHVAVASASFDQPS